MGNWKKSKPTAGVYAVMPVGRQFGVGLYQPGQPPERVRSVGLRISADHLQHAVDRLNSRIGVSKERAAEIAGAA